MVGKYAIISGSCQLPVIVQKDFGTLLRDYLE